jgi:hypothetical protein
VRALRVVVVFIKTSIGRVTKELMTDPLAALLYYPEICRILSKGPDITASQFGPTTVRVEHNGFYGLSEYPLGILEALVMYYGCTPSIDVEICARDELAFVIRWE